MMESGLSALEQPQAIMLVRSGGGAGGLKRLPVVETGLTALEH
jgi:hypothetical protein